jgi:hypothetical protein
MGKKDSKENVPRLKVNVKRTNEQTEDKGQSKSKQTTRESLKTLYMTRVRVCVCVWVYVYIYLICTLSSISMFQWRLSMTIKIYEYIRVYTHNLLLILHTFTLYVCILE